MILQIYNLTKRYPNFALEEISLEIEEGEYFVLLGASGTGKTVLLEMIAGMDSVDDGMILFDRKDITYCPIQNRGIGLVYQDQALFPHLTVKNNIAYSLRNRKLSSSEIEQIVAEYAEKAACAHLLHRKPETLSGGEAQRVALARVLVMKPQLLLFDEPLSALDTGTRSEMRSLFRQLNSEGYTILHVTHDCEEAISLAHRVGVMDGGRLVQVGRPEEILHHPKSSFVAHFVGIKNFFFGKISSIETEIERETVFQTKGITMHLLQNIDEGEGTVFIRSEDVVISVDTLHSSSRNSFKGRVTELIPALVGIEVLVDISVEIVSLITAKSAYTLSLQKGKEVYVSFKASAVKCIKG